MLAVCLGGAAWGVVKRSAAHDYEDDVCHSRVKDPSKDSDHATCSSWCSIAMAKVHCDWCKCRACEGMCASDKASPPPPAARGGLGPLRQVALDWSRANHSQHAATGKAGSHSGSGHHQTEPARLLPTVPTNRTGSNGAVAKPGAAAATTASAAAAAATAAAVRKQVPSVTPAPDPAAARESWRRERETSKTVSMVVGIGLGCSILCLVAAVVSSIRKMQAAEAAEREAAMREDLHDSCILASTPADTPTAKRAGGGRLEFGGAPNRGSIQPS